MIPVPLTDSASKSPAVRAARIRLPLFFILLLSFLMVIFLFCHFPVLSKNDTIRYYNDKGSFLSTSGRKLHIFAAVLRGICKVFLRKHGYGKAQAPIQKPSGQCFCTGRRAFSRGKQILPAGSVYGLDGIYLVFLICLFRIHAGLLGFTVLEEVLGHGREQGIR